MQPLVVFGASGHARVIIDAARCAKNFELIGIFDSRHAAGHMVDGVRVLGTDDLLPKLKSGNPSITGIVGVGDNRRRQAVVETILGQVPDFPFATVVHPTAIVAADVVIGPGTFLAAGAVVNTGSRIGSHAVINTNAGVDHDAVIEDFGFVGPGAALAGTVRMGRAAFVGTGATVAPNVTIGADVVVGAGAVVLRDVPTGATVVGVPARPIADR